MLQQSTAVHNLKAFSAQIDVEVRCYAFVRALLDVSLEQFETFHSVTLGYGTMDYRPSTLDESAARLERLAFAMRDFMNEDMSFKSGHGERRRGFYAKVFSEMRKYLVEMSSRTKLAFDDQKHQERIGKLRATALKLYDFLNPEGAEGRLGLLTIPLVVFIDEAGALAENVDPSSKSTTWTVFTELRRVWREISQNGFILLLSSTTGSRRKIVPDVQVDPSARIHRFDLYPYPPMSEVGFDLFAPEPDDHSLDYFASTYHISHLGRAL
jgi:hypothetical protein